MSVNIQELRRSTAELLRRIEREDREEKLVETIEQRVEAAIAERMRPPAEPPPKRSAMSPAEKSRYIRAQGLDAYQRLDWS
jgi:hypothetical protein